jgi:uncharacterized protein YcsI (UPF0317 family)
MRRKSGRSGGQRVAVWTSVRVYPGTERERIGVVVEDFGDTAGHPVHIGEQHIVEAARRWGVQLGDGDLVFVDSADLEAV